MGIKLGLLSKYSMRWDLTDSLREDGGYNRLQRQHSALFIFVLGEGNGNEALQRKEPKKRTEFNRKDRFSV
jgi:hypothetical protein